MTALDAALSLARGVIPKNRWSNKFCKTPRSFEERPAKSGHGPAWLLDYDARFKL